MTTVMPDAPQISIDLIESWRTLGSDYAAWRQALPTDASEEFREGYAEGKRQRQIRKPDRYVLKWLHVRYNALNRGRVVDKNVTVDFLRSIDVPVCPVTLVELGHRGHEDSNWSIDRVNNDGAYAPENLIVISTRANKAKGNKTFDNVCGLSMQDTASEGLEPKEWLRLAMLMQGACAAETDENPLRLPLVTKLPPHCARPVWLQIQYVIHRAASKQSERKKAESRMNQICLDGLTVEKLKMLIDTVRDMLGVNRKSKKYEYDVWSSEKVKRLLHSWVVALGPHGQNQLRLAVRDLAGGHSLQKSEVEAWSLLTRGYLTK